MVEIFNASFGKAIRATRSFAAGNVVHREIGCAVLAAPTKYTIQRSPTQHLECREAIKYTNHSFTPNCKVVFGGTQEVALVACAEIAVGSELTINYNDTETKMAEPFTDIATGRPVEGSDS